MTVFYKNFKPKFLQYRYILPDLEGPLSKLIPFLPQTVKKSVEKVAIYEEVLKPGSAPASLLKFEDS